MHQSHSPVQGHCFLLSFPNFLPISCHFSAIDCYFSIFCLPLPSFCHPVPPMQKACHNTVQNPHSLWTMQHSLFGSDIVSVVMCILNAESPQCYSLYKYIGCSEGLEYKRRTFDGLCILKYFLVFRVMNCYWSVFVLYRRKKVFENFWGSMGKGWEWIVDGT